jgi:glycine cleavage system H protein
MRIALLLKDDDFSSILDSCFQHRFCSSFPHTHIHTAHEYITVDDKGIGTCGITDFAQAALGDIVFVDLPEVGDEFDKGDSFGSVESVKAASDIYAPVGGKVVEINQALTDKPELVNSDAEGNAWFIKLEMKDKAELGGLMDAESYKAHCDKEAH